MGNKKIERSISSLRRTAKKHRDLFIEARDKAEELEKPIILADLKKKYEGKYFTTENGGGGITWATYVYCIEITSFVKGLGFLHAYGRVVIFEDMKERGLSIRRTETDDTIAHLLQKEISKKKFMDGAYKISHALLSPFTIIEK